MLDSNRGFTVVQFITAMTVCGLLLVGLFVQIAKVSQRENQRRSDLGLVEAMVGRYAENHLGRYPSTKQASKSGSELQVQFEMLRLLDPKTGKYYVLGSDFGECNGGADTADRGPGYVSYKSPGDNGPYTLRICLERGDYYLGD
jgi:hypothetical protein